MAMNVWLCAPANNPASLHGECNREWAESFRDAFIECGHASSVVGDNHDPRIPTLAIGAHLLDGTPMPDNHIILQLEQIEQGSPWLNDKYLGHLRRNRVWDYSPQNVAALKQLGINAELCEIGFSPSLQRVPVAEEDIDIFFAGSMNERRQKLLKALAENGLTIDWLPPGTYGAARDQYMARAKIVLNVHYYESKIFEIFRCGYAMANAKCIVSEKGADTAMEQIYAGGIAFCEYDQMLDKCKELVANSDQRSDIAWNGYEIFSARRQAQFIEPLLNAGMAKAVGA